MRVPILAVLLLLLSACADTTPETDRGGSVAFTAARIAQANYPRRLPGYCVSACTMWLGYDEACVEPGASFGFHRVARDPLDAGQRVYEAHLPKGLRAWYRREAAHSDEIVRLPASRLIAEDWAVPCEER